METGQVSGDAAKMGRSELPAHYDPLLEVLDRPNRSRDTHSAGAYHQPEVEIGMVRLME